MRIFIFFITFCSFLVLPTNSSAQEFEDYLAGIEITDIHGDGNIIWIATRGQGIFKYDLMKDSWENYSTVNERINHDFFYCLASNKDYIFAGSTDGLYILNKKRDRWQKRKFGKGGQLSNWIRSIAYDKYENVVWIGRFKYLSKFDIKKRRFRDYDLTVQGDMKSNTIISIAVDGDSLVWFGTEAGLHKYNKRMDLSEPNSVEFYDNSLNYFNAEGDKVSVTCILFENKNVWIGLDEFLTSDNPDYNIGGLFKFNRKNDWFKFSTRNGLAGNGINCIEKTGKYIWAGLYQFSRETKEPYGRGVALINTVTESVKMLYSNKIPQTVYSIYFDGECMWFGTKSGITRVYLNNKFADFGDY